MVQYKHCVTVLNTFFNETKTKLKSLLLGPRKNDQKSAASVSNDNIINSINTSEKKNLHLDLTTVMLYFQVFLISRSIAAADLECCCLSL